ncbi:transcriptional regulator [Catellatospora methionotrophica]|uniref:Transcriptional regulator n=1 Tax=Catellatospora methionotrophica TaxID=121620 RepID=A0A8J3PG24_9ACTN|nr:helix-turn-helix transcriptional regulator [Catellatospora methionotrophica]GIG15274.1 transcriptional regulator [Catellatospora methionotrophica]
MKSPERPSPEPIGDKIKRLREIRGYSVRHAAALAGISHTQWGRIEKGQRSADNRFQLADIAQALKVSLADLTGAAGLVAGDYAHTRTAVAQTMQAVIEADLEDPPLAAPVPMDLLLQRLDLAQSLRFKCDYTGASTVLPELLKGLHATSFGQDRPRALRGLVLAQETASFVVRYLGDPASAVMIADRSRQAATALGDPVVMGLSAWTQAHAAAGCGLYPRAQRIADRAVADLEQAPGLPDGREMLGQLLMVAAFTRYAQGDVGGAASAVAEAERLAELTGQSAALGLNFGPTNIRFWQVNMDADGAHPGRAVEIARHVNPNDVPVVSRQAGFHIDVARALANIGQDQAAIRQFLLAERLAPQRVRMSPIVQETARGMLERARRGTGWVELRGLCERVGVAL